MGTLLLAILPYLSTLKSIGYIAIFVILGEMVYNRFNKEEDKDVRGMDLLLIILLFSTLIHFGVGWIPFVSIKYITATVFGMSGNKLVKSWIDGEIWKRYDFLSKGKALTKHLEEDNKKEIEKKADETNSPDNQEE